MKNELQAFLCFTVAYYSKRTIVFLPYVQAYNFLKYSIQLKRIVETTDRENYIKSAFGTNTW